MTKEEIYYIPIEGGPLGRPKKYTYDVISKYAKKFKTWLKDPDNVWIKDFVLQNDLDNQTVKSWTKEHEEFAAIYQYAKDSQESKLINGGLTNKYNAAFVKFILNVRHNWVEKKETVHSNNPDNPVPEWIMNSQGTSKDLVSEPEE